MMNRPRFTPSKMVMGVKGKSKGIKGMTRTVLDYAVEEGRVIVTIEPDGITDQYAEANGGQNIMQIQLLDGDRVKWVRDEDRGAYIIMNRVGDASSE